MQTALVWLNARPVACLVLYQVHNRALTRAFSSGHALQKRHRQLPKGRRHSADPRCQDKIAYKPPRLLPKDDHVKGPLYAQLGNLGRPAPKHVLPGSKWMDELPTDPKRTWRGARRMDFIPTDDHLEPIPNPPTTEARHPNKGEVEFVPHLVPGEPGYPEPFGNGPARKLVLQSRRPLVRKYITDSSIEAPKPRAGMAVDIRSEMNLELPHTRAGSEIGIWNVEHDFESRFRVQGYNYQGIEESEEIIELLALLQSMARTLGKEGIAITWHQMREKKLMCIPTVGPAALNIWRIFLMNPQLHEDIFEYAVEVQNITGDVYEPLYEHILGQRLATSSEDTFSWHQKFKKVYKIPRDALRRLVERATTSTNSLAIFMDMYTDNHRNSDPIYDFIITRLVGRHMYQEAIAWHTKLFTCGDLPSVAVSRSSLMDRFQRFRNRVAATSLLDHIPPTKGTVLESGATLRRVDGSFGFNRRTVYSLLGEKHGIAPKTFTDEFCARLFATKSFSTALVISSLKMFGIQAIGPLALREMAIKEADPEVIKQKVKELAAAGISLGKSVFSRAVMKLSEDGRADLLRNLLDSDQHPDVLEDTPLQRKLLASYLSQNDWLSVHRTLVILTLFHEDPAQESWNLLFRHYLQSKLSRSCREAALQAQNLKRKVQQVMFDMSMAKVQVTAESVQSLLRQLLAPRRSGRRPISRPKSGSNLDDLNFVTHILFRITSTGQILPAIYWRELIRRYGMLGRFESMARLCLRLVKLYSPPSQLQLLLSVRLPATVTRRDPILANHDIDPQPASTLNLSHPAHPFQQLFNAAAVQAFVAWGFQLGTQLLQSHPERRRYHASLQSRVRDAPWPSHIEPPSLDQVFLRGVALIDKLRQHGVLVDTSVVEKMIRQRLWQLYSPTLSWRMINRRSQLLNPYSLEECLRGVLDIWKGPTLFPSLLLKEFEDYGPKADVVLQPAAPEPSASSRAHCKFPSFEFEFDAMVSEKKNLEGEDERTAQLETLDRPAETTRTILSELCSNAHLTLAQQVHYRRTIVRILFGSNPMLGHRRRTEARRVNPDAWDEVVTDWARRGGKGRFRMRVGGLARTEKGEVVIVRKKRVLREGMVRRRNRSVVSGRGSKAVGYVKRD